MNEKEWKNHKCPNCKTWNDITELDERIRCNYCGFIGSEKQFTTKKFNVYVKIKLSWIGSDEKEVREEVPECFDCYELEDFDPEIIEIKEVIDLKDFYNHIKEAIIKKGYKKEIEWVENIPSLEKQDKLCFFREYCWVVINSGMKNTVARKIFIQFWNDGHLDFNIIGHPTKKNALKEVYNRLDFHFEHLKQSENKLMYLESLPHIGPVTKYHLARNLGLDFSKPDRHLVRIANAFEYQDVQKFCKDVSNLSGDKIGVVDIIFWRFATINDNYLELINNWK